MNGGGSGDSLRARSRYEDSITVRIYHLDSIKPYKLDSSVSDFTRRFPVPATYITLGNTGTAAKSILFAPSMRTGWDPGFHTFDVYKWKLENIHFFNTTRPYTELNYELAGNAEQIIEILHTQNIKPYWNFSLNYRLLNSPGFFRNQKTDHNNYQFTSWYQSRNKRYNNYLVLLDNNLQSGENGGIENESDLNNPAYDLNRLAIPTKIGGTPVSSYSSNFFSKALFTGNHYNEFTLLLRQQYDFGKKDSIVTDSTVIPLFFPRVRFEHTFKLTNAYYSFRDYPAYSQSQTNTPDSNYYSTYYNIHLPQNDSLFFQDKWKQVSNDFSIYQFPDAKNLQQFIKIGGELQLMHGTFFRDSASSGSASLYNFIGHGEYRNHSKNQKWDMLANGELYLVGSNFGNYHAYASLQRLLSNKFGSLQIGFENTNRSPSFIFDPRSGFYLDVPRKFSNENITHFFGSVYEPKLRLQLSADYYLMGNYLYITSFDKLQQENTLFNVLRINALKTFKVGRRWNWYAEVYVQQKTGAAQLHIPTVFTRNRFMYEGNLGFKKLSAAFGLEVKYYTPYKADNYSPILGQFFYQDSVTISNLPDVDLFLHFRIRGFKAFLRAENLNTARFSGGSFHFNNNNLSAPDYPTQGLNFRLGIYWSFVN